MRSDTDMLARLSIHTLNDPSPAYAPLLARLLTVESIPNTTLTILLDWAEPWKFLRLLQAWVRLLKQIVDNLPEPERQACEDNRIRWQQNRDADTDTSITDSHTPMPLGPGEYDEPLGLPLLVVCQNALAIERLEKERGYREHHFDYIMQNLRTVLLKHGAGLIYTMPSQPGQLQPLVYRTLDIGSTMPGERLSRGKNDAALKHNVVDRDRVMVPPGWDSWGKIRVLREGFDVEGVSQSWSVEIQQRYSASSTEQDADEGLEADAVHEARQDTKPTETESQSVVAPYEAQIQNPRPPDTTKPYIEVELKPDQVFLAEQLERLESFRAEDEADAAKKQREQARRTTSADESAGRATMHEHIGPVQFNMGGIQYDADEAVRRLKVSPPSLVTILLLRTRH